MQVIRNTRQNHFKQGCVATIGNFDGVHLGHQEIIKQLLTLSKKYKLPAVVITFDPHPREFFSNFEAPTRLNRFREKVTLLKRYGIENVICLCFDKQFSEIPAEDFIQKILLDKFNIKHLIVGKDFRFGKGREGNYDLLCQQTDCQIGLIDEITHNKKRISSTAIRMILFTGRLNLAKKMLGHSFSMMGHVVYGDQRGRTIGFPTANINVAQRLVPIQGVFAVYVRGVNDKVLQGVANIGTRPTVDGKRHFLEVHIFDFDADIYGELIEVEFMTRIRDEIKFDSIDELKKQIQCDVKQAKECFQGVDNAI